MALYVTVVVVLAAAAAGFILLRARLAGIALHKHIDTLSEMVHNEVSSLRAEVQRAGGELRELDARVTGVEDSLRDVHSQLHEVTAQTSALATATQDCADLMARRLSRPMPIGPDLLKGKSEDEIVGLAESLSIVRPLVPYPRWRTDLDFLYPDFAFQLRRWFWQYFKDGKRETPITVPWHEGTYLRLFLGSDLSRQIYVGGCCEPNEFAVIDRLLRPGMTFVDAGANDGMYTVFAARRVGDTGAVWAFEPSARELDRLQYNLSLNQLKARVFPIALSDHEGEAQLTVATFEHTGCNTLGAFAYPDFEVARRESVIIRRLDDVFAEDPPARVDVLKIDVEGGELNLLRGAGATLRQYRPVVLFEVSQQSLQHQGATPDELVEFVRSSGYSIYAFDSDTGLPVRMAGALTDNVIAFPSEMRVPGAIQQPWPWMGARRANYDTL